MAVCCIVLGAFLPATGAAQQEMELPVDVQVSLFLRVLSFDRQLSARAGGELAVAVVMQRGYRASQKAGDEALSALNGSGTNVGGVPVRATAIDLDTQSLADALARRPATVLYFAPLRGVDVRVLAAAASAAGALTVTGVPRYVTMGVAVGARLQGERPRLLLNLQAARRAGADFSAELLKLAEVIP
jgi:hypothetical protein